MTVLIIAAAVIFLAWVLVRAVRVAQDALREEARPVLHFDDAELLDLVAEKRQALAHLKEGELDFETGKVGEADYAEVRADNAADAIDVMKRLDDVRAALRYDALVDRDLAELAAGTSEVARASSAAVAAVAAPGGVLLAPAVAGPADGLSAAARLRRARQGGNGDGAEKAAPPAQPEVAKAACPACSAPVLASDKFCPSCGYSLNRTCDSCGVALRPGTRFCHECGARVERAGEPA